MVWNLIINNIKICKLYILFNDCGIIMIVICELEFNVNVIRFFFVNVFWYYLFDWRYNRIFRIWIYMNIFLYKSIVVMNLRVLKFLFYRVIVFNEDFKIGFKYCRILIMLSLKLYKC